MRPGEILVGKYRVDRVLGQGGMGLVVQAMHLQLGQPVAVKFLLPEVLQHPGVVERFLREAQAAVRLRSEHVARVIDVGTLETGAPYMVLEYLDGTDLAAYPRSHLDLGTIVDLMLQACEALAEAHALGIVHRDIKPANFFITQRPDGSPLLKVLDFGISKLQTQTDASLTATQTVIGTPAYMSPEQMKSARGVDHRSDIWSLGVVLYELLEGTPPFQAETFTSLAIKVATEPVRPLARRYPPGVAEIVMRCLEKEPAARFRNVAELAGALAPYARSQTQAAITLERTSKVLRSPSYPALPATIAANPGQGATTPMPMRAPTPPPGTGPGYYAPGTAPGAPGTLTGASGAFAQGATTGVGAGAGGRKAWPWMLGGVVLVGGIVALAVVFGGGHGGAKSNEPAAAATAGSGAGGSAASGSSTNTATGTTTNPDPATNTGTANAGSNAVTANAGSNAATANAGSNATSAGSNAATASAGSNATTANAGSDAATNPATANAGSNAATANAGTTAGSTGSSKKHPKSTGKHPGTTTKPPPENGTDDILDGRQ